MSFPEANTRMRNHRFRIGNPNLNLPICQCDWEGNHPLLLLMVQKSGDHQLRLVVYPIIYKVSYIPDGAGFLLSTVPPRIGTISSSLHGLVGVTFATHRHAEQPCIIEGDLTWSSTEQLQEEKLGSSTVERGTRNLCRLVDIHVTGSEICGKNPVGIR